METEVLWLGTEVGAGVAYCLIHPVSLSPGTDAGTLERGHGGDGGAGVSTYHSLRTNRLYENLA